MDPYDKPVCQISKLLEFVYEASDSTKSDDYYDDLWYLQNSAVVEENDDSPYRPNPILHLCAFWLFIIYAIIFILRYLTVPKNSIP